MWYFLGCDSRFGNEWASWFLPQLVSENLYFFQTNEPVLCPVAEG